LGRFEGDWGGVVEGPERFLVTRFAAARICLVCFSSAKIGVRDEGGVLARREGLEGG